MRGEVCRLCLRFARLLLRRNPPFPKPLRANWGRGRRGTLLAQLFYFTNFSLRKNFVRGEVCRLCLRFAPPTITTQLTFSKALAGKLGARAQGNPAGAVILFHKFFLAEKFRDIIWKKFFSFLRKTSRVSAPICAEIQLNLPHFFDFFQNRGIYYNISCLLCQTIFSPVFACGSCFWNRSPLLFRSS